MTTTAKRLDLLGHVLPFFANEAKSIADDNFKGSTAWIDHILIQVTLNGMIGPVTALASRFRKRDWSSAERECENTTKVVLQLLESWSGSDYGKSRQIDFVAKLEFPKLEEIRAQVMLPKLNHQSGSGCKETLRTLMRCGSTYDKLCSEANYPKWTERPTGRTPSLDLREHLRLLHDILEDFWQCHCRASHEGMLFLATHHADHDGGEVAKFDLLLSSTQPSIWNEAQVFVANSRESKLPGIVNAVEHVCNMIRDNQAKSRLRLVINESSPWKSTPRACMLGVRDLPPSKTILDVLREENLDRECTIVLAVILAYNFLYLCGSSWFPSPWDKTAIKFLRHDRGPGFNEIIRPLIAPKNTRSAEGAVLLDGKLHNDQARLALGVILLEIFRQEAIEDLRDEDEECAYDDSGGLTTDTNLYTAYNVLDDTDWNVHQGYKKAVMACLDSAKVDGKPWGDIEHCQFIYSDVIAPLEQELKAYCGIHVGELDEKIRRQAGAARSSTTGISPRDVPIRTSSNPTTVAALGPSAVPRTTLPHGLKASQESDTSVQRADSDAQFLLRRDDVGGSDYTTGRLDHDGPSSGMRAPGQSCSNLHILTPLSLFHVQSSKGELDQLAQEWFDDLHEEMLKMTPHRRMPRERRIKIAVLDTGVRQDVLERWKQASKTNRVSYKSFVPGESDHPARDDADHGTHTAALLLRVAPNAEIHIARIADRFESGTVDSITRAVKHYTDKEKVDIISMSFGFPQLDQSLDGLKMALGEAHAKNIVLFAAGHNSGALRDVSYPANQDHVICIGACDGHGNPSPFNPSSVSNMFCILGQGIVTSCQLQDPTSKSGTSFATPIAASIAAFVMDWVMDQSQNWLDEERYHARKVKTKKAIVSIFEQKLSESRSGYRVLMPSRFFRERNVRNAGRVLLDDKHADMNMKSVQLFRELSFACQVKRALRTGSDGSIIQSRHDLHAGSVAMLLTAIT